MSGNIPPHIGSKLGMPPPPEAMQATIPQEAKEAYIAKEKETAELPVDPSPAKPTNFKDIDLDAADLTQENTESSQLAEPNPSRKRRGLKKSRKNRKTKEIELENRSVESVNEPSFIPDESTNSESPETDSDPTLEELEALAGPDDLEDSDLDMDSLEMIEDKEGNLILDEDELSDREEPSRKDTSLEKIVELSPDTSAVDIDRQKETPSQGDSEEEQQALTANADFPSKNEEIEVLNEKELDKQVQKSDDEESTVDVSGKQEEIQNISNENKATSGNQEELNGKGTEDSAANQHKTAPISRLALLNNPPEEQSPTKNENEMANQSKTTNTRKRKSTASKKETTSGNGSSQKERQEYLQNLSKETKSFLEKLREERIQRSKEVQQLRENLRKDLANSRTQLSEESKKLKDDRSEASNKRKEDLTNLKKDVKSKWKKK